MENSKLISNFYGLDFPEEFPSTFEPLEAVLIVSGVEMETGLPTCTVLETKGANPWEVIGMMEAEVFRRKMVINIIADTDYEEFDDED